MSNRHYKSIELFAGAGGLALGLEQAGFQHIALVDFDKASTETLKQNRPYWNVLCEDIKNIVSRDLEKEFNIKKGNLDLLSGGAPCQSFSYAGKRLGLEDTRGTMFYYYATFLHKLYPKIFLFENVKGLLNHDGGKTFETIQNVLKNEGYTLKYKVMNSWDYNVPQKRERLILVGIRHDLHVEFEFPEKSDAKPCLKDINLEINPDPKTYIKYSQRKIDLFKQIGQGEYWKVLPMEIAKEYMGAIYDNKGGSTGCLRRLSLNEPSLTILTNPNMKMTDRCHPIENRPLTVRETARIQTFPDNYEICGNLLEQYKQIGNAVPVNLAKVIGKSIIKILEKL